MAQTFYKARGPHGGGGQNDISALPSINIGGGGSSPLCPQLPTPLDKGRPANLFQIFNLTIRCKVSDNAVDCAHFVLELRIQ